MTTPLFTPEGKIYTHTHTPSPKTHRKRRRKRLKVERGRTNPFDDDVEELSSGHVLEHLVVVLRAIPVEEIGVEHVWVLHLAQGAHLASPYAHPSEHCSLPSHMRARTRR